jgi:cysteinyl-tRNA synthetase
MFFFSKPQKNISLYNTLTRKKEDFKPIKNGEVKFYQCGPTVYWTQHIGNLRAMVLSDFMRRTLSYLGYKVTFVRNYTDVGHLTSDSDIGEDKMEKAVKREGGNPKEIADKYIKIFENDTKNLNILEPDSKPRATEYVKDIIEAVKILMEKGYAYSTDLAIYFDISKANDYTKLSGQNLEENKSGAGNANIEDSQKKNPADFSLWFFKAGKHEKALQYWPSPFDSLLVKNGEGFPGWHIECSIMIKKLLGKTIDVHMGGIEHIPVHHTNEIAQSEALNNVPLANYWLHNEWLIVNGGKMAKSEGSSYSLSEIREKGFNPLVLRYFFMQAHYRSKQNFTWEALQGANSGYEHLKNQVKELGGKIGKVDKNFKNKFEKIIGDDFNIPQALALLQEILKSDIPKENKLTTIYDFDKVFGLDLKKGLHSPVAVSDEIIKLAEERKLARETKDWKKSDELRNKILSLGYEIKDTLSGYEIVKK